MSGTIVSNINCMFSNDLIRLVLLLMTTVFVGYTIEPIPTILKNLFANSWIFKFIILVAFGILTMYPLKDTNTLIHIIIASMVTMAVFQFLR